jgi:hypothetical protein
VLCSTSFLFRFGVPGNPVMIDAYLCLGYTLFLLVFFVPLPTSQVGYLVGMSLLSKANDGGLNKKR